MNNKSFVCPENREKGSIILIVLMVLTLLTVAGISATYMSTTESYIVRNATLHKQNFQLAEAAAFVGIRRILNADVAPQATWIFDQDPANTTRFYELDTGGKIDGDVEIYNPDLLAQRGEADDETLWYYFVWIREPFGDDLHGTGKVVGVYNSGTYGRAAVEIGIEREFYAAN